MSHPNPDVERLMKTKIKLGLAWLVVGVPLAWGVLQSVKKSMPLFGASPSAGQPSPRIR